MSLSRKIVFMITVLPVIIVIYSMKTEEFQYSLAKSTLTKYKLKSVCARHPSQESNFTTMRGLDEASSLNMQVVHCGQCGHCSNLNDITVMKNTKDTLTKTATKCALRGLFFGDKAADVCLEEKIGFTLPCSKCWSDNIRCTRNKCKFTCLKSILLKESNNRDGIHLNPCLECDEKMCGPAFIECAGANRRRLGIESDIKRDVLQEQCKYV